MLEGIFKEPDSSCGITIVKFLTIPCKGLRREAIDSLNILSFIWTIFLSLFCADKVERERARHKVKIKVFVCVCLSECKS